MIKVFFFRFANAGITDADGPFKISRELAFDRGKIPIPESLAECIRPWCILSCLLLEPLEDLFSEDLADLLVRYDQLERTIRSFITLGQITGDKEHSP